MTTMPNLARANAILDEIDAGPPPPAWSPPSRPSTLVAPILDADGMWRHANAAGRATLAAEQFVGEIPVLIRHRADLGVHGLVVHLERHAGVLWATALVDDHAAHLVRCGQYGELSPSLYGRGHTTTGSDGVDYTDMLDARIIECSLVERSASRIGPVGVTPSDVRRERSGLPFAWGDAHRQAYRSAWEALAPRSDVARYRASLRPSPPAAPSVGGGVGVMHRRYFEPDTVRLRVR